MTAGLALTTRDDGWVRCQRQATLFFNLVFGLSSKFGSSLWFKKVQKYVYCACNYINDIGNIYVTSPSPGGTYSTV